MICKGGKPENQASHPCFIYNRKIWDSHHRENMVHMTDVEIVSQVNAEIKGMYNYYSIAENATVIKNFAFILEYSMYKTFGLKYRKSVYKIQISA